MEYIRLKCVIFFLMKVIYFLNLICPTVSPCVTLSSSFLFDSTSFWSIILPLPLAHFPSLCINAFPSWFPDTASLWCYSPLSPQVNPCADSFKDVNSGQEFHQISR